MTIMTSKNIETLIVCSLIQEKEGFEDILTKINEDYFKNEKLKKLFIYIKENGVKEINLFMFQEGFSDTEVKKILNLEHEYSIEDLINFFIQVYKDRTIEETIKEFSSLSPKEREEKLKEVVLEIENTNYSTEINDSKKCLNKYEKYLESARTAFENNDGQIGISTGIPSLNEKITGIKNSEYILVAARPSMGKTSLTTGFFTEAIIDTNLEGVPVMFSLEMETEQIMGRMIAQMNDSLSLANTIFGKDRENTQMSISEVVDFLKEKEFYIEDFSDESGRKLEITPQDLDIKLKEIERKHGKIKLIIIDYLQLMSSSNKRISSSNERLTDISSKVKALGRKYGCPVISLSQLNRELEKRQDKRPQLSDLRESGALEQDADIIMFVYRPEVYLEKELKEKLKSKPNDPGLERELALITQREFTEAEIIIGKQRNGPTGIVNTFFYKKNARFGDLEGDCEIENIYLNPELYEMEED